MSSKPKPRQKSQSIIPQVVEDDLLLLDESSGKVHQLNPSARVIWNACNGKNSVEAIVAIVVEKFSIDTHTASRDVNATLENFAALELIDYVQEQ